MEKAQSAQEATTKTKLARLGVDPERGFLPGQDPLRQLPLAFPAWDQIGAELPKLLIAGRVRDAVEALPTLDPAPLDERETERAMVLLSFVAHGYVWETWRTSPRSHLPVSIALPWYQVARRLGRPPVLSYASYALNNWRRLDPDQPVQLGNIALLQNFLGGLDEDWFVDIHIDIEAKAGPALAAILDAQEAVSQNRLADVQGALRTIADAAQQMYATLCRMTENCDPYIYYNRVRPYIHGFTQHPLVYEGVADFQNQPQSFHGETGAQSTIVPSLDAALGIEHQTDELRVYLNKMRDYMPPAHRTFLAAVENGPSIRSFVSRHRNDARDLVDVYDECVHWVEAFRQEHLEYAAAYIQKQSEDSPHNSTTYGTGGTPFMPYLKKHRNETSAHQLG